MTSFYITPPNEVLDFWYTLYTCTFKTMKNGCAAAWCIWWSATVQCVHKVWVWLECRLISRVDRAWAAWVSKCSWRSLSAAVSLWRHYTHIHMRKNTHTRAIGDWLRTCALSSGCGALQRIEGDWCKKCRPPREREKKMYTFRFRYICLYTSFRNIWVHIVLV